MSAFAGAHAGGATWQEALSRCLDALGAVPDGANLGFLYASDTMTGDLPALLDALRARTGIADWCGSIGIGVCAGEAEYFGETALVLLVAALPEDSWRLFGPLGAGARLDADVAAWVERKRPMLGVVHADPRDPEVAETTAALAAATETFLVGGLASSRGALRQIARRPVEGGISGVFLAPEVAVATGLTQGCSPIGPTRRITASEQHLILTIDERPALEIFKEDIGELLSRDLRRVGGLIYAAFPVRGTDTGDYLVRNLVAIDLQREAIAVAGAFEPGDPILFCRRDAPSAAKDLDRMLAQLRSRCGNAAPKAGLYFSCLARGPNLFGADAEELGRVSAALGADVPLAGFFANGEICHDRLYAYTGVLTVFL